MTDRIAIHPDALEPAEREKSVLRAIVVDDELHARSEMRYLLEDAGGVEVVAEACSVRQAIDRLRNHVCDVMFLDVGLPDASGMQLAEAMRQLKAPVAVVFVTASQEHALDAFRVSAVDYLLKPVDPHRLDVALERVADFVELNMRVQRIARVAVDRDGKKFSLAVDKVRFIMARDDYSYLYTDEERYFSSVSLASLERQLLGQGFFRSHRGYLVNLSFVSEVEAQKSGTLLLTLDGVAERVPVSRRRATALKRALGI